MNSVETKVLHGYLSTLLVIWLAFSWMVVSSFEKTIADQLVMILWGFFMLGGLNWGLYTLYLAARVVPKVDALVNPTLREVIKLRGDDWMTRVFRLIDYAHAASCRWYGRRMRYEYNFSNLPRSLSLPLRIHAYWLWSNVVAMVVGSMLVSQVR